MLVLGPRRPDPERNSQTQAKKDKGKESDTYERFAHLGEPGFLLLDVGRAVCWDVANVFLDELNCFSGVHEAEPVATDGGHDCSRRGDC